ncbi:unnamed protein product [Adineta steineri]|uniref:Fibronectin type-III domain-containing protein n=1 Tax=Adineta steineri TaxID=433720 RepID=A0A815DZQ3_9BILA|nr:unnamed protein product [Adineta steineri]CAF1303406.1 unnamed protein product [Adineta steineri]CAF1304457.1 unnamed protein product [Adineta steineri]
MKLGIVIITQRFHVKTPPKLTREPEEQRVPLGETSKVKKDDQSSADDDRVHTEREDAGTYAINVANDSGSCNVPLKVKIIAPPLPPTGPLEISNVSKDRATLSWKPPKDDSGSKVTGYVVERRDTSKGADVWIPVTQACNETTFTVPSLLDEHEYDFRVMAINENGTKLPGSPGQPNITGMTNNTVTLNWDKLTSDDDVPISGYWIEKREGNTDKWMPVNMSINTFYKNEAGKGTPSDATTPTKVKDPNASTTAPEFLKKFKDTKEISQGAKYTITRDDDKCILVINNATPDDAIEWSIKARNKGGSRMCRCNVNVRSPPRFRLPPNYQDILNYDKGESIVIKIPYIGSPLPNVMLSKDENDITKDKNVSLDVSDRAIILSIRNGNKNTTGHQPERVTLKHGNISDYYDIDEEIGR